MNADLVFPIVIPLVTAAISLLFWRKRLAQRVIALVGALALLVSAIVLLWNVSASGIRVERIGAWPAPYGIVFVADLLSAMMVLIAGVLGVVIVLYSLGSIDRERESFGFYPLLHVLLMGVCGAFLTGDLFNLYVWFEVMLMASFVLLALGGERPQMEGAIKYVTLNLLSSALFLSAVGLLYGLVGTLNMADVASKLDGVERPALVSTIAMLLLVAFGIKAAIFPLFFWLPASYHTPPAAVTAIFAGLLSKVGVYSLIRVFTLLFVAEPGFTHTTLLVVAGFTMVTGVLGAMAQNDFRRLLAFHIVSQIGYTIMGLALLTPLALMGAVFFLAHNIFAKTTLFLVSGAAWRIRGTYDLKKLGGLASSSPVLALAFLVPALSLAGLPPSTGFLGKLSLIRAGFDVQSWTIVAVALVVSAMTLFSMLKIWNEAFWKPKPGEETVRDRSCPPLMLVPIAALALVTFGFGIYGVPALDFAARVAEQLLDRAEYIRAVAPMEAR